MASNNNPVNASNYETRYRLSKAPEETPDTLLKSLLFGVGQAQDIEGALEAIAQIICRHYNWHCGEAWQFNPETHSLPGHANKLATPPNLAAEATPPLAFKVSEKSVLDTNKAPTRRIEDSPRQDSNPSKIETAPQISAPYPIRFRHSDESCTCSLGISPIATSRGSNGKKTSIVKRVWKSQRAEWHHHVLDSATCPNLRASVSLPLVANSRTLAVLVFFSGEVIAQDPTLIEYINAIAIPLDMLFKQGKFKEKLAIERELAQVTLNSIGDAVITTDELGRIRHLNPVAETLTGWTQSEAASHPVSAVFKTIHEITRKPTANPITQVLIKQQAIDLVNYNILITRNGVELPIENSAAPLKTGDGQIIGVVMVFNDVSKTRLLTRQISWQASHDELTGLINRREFERRLSQAVDNASSHQRMHALCYIDLDNFKIINDTCGHASGDKLLKQVSALFTGHIRATDTLARLGGDEFGLLLEYCQLDHAQRIVSKLREKLKDLRFTCQSRTFSVGASIGVTAITAKTQSVEDALSDADGACHIAKRKGRNRTYIHQHNDLELAQQRSEIQWAAYITEALETGKFSLYQQQILSLDPNCPSSEHYEVLLRLCDQTGQLVSPDAFMPAAERYDLMPLIDRWVVSTLFKVQASYYQQVWAASQSPATKQTAEQTITGSHLYSINLSGASISDDSFIYFLKEQFSKYRIPPRSNLF